jgi:hypothetical protein
MKRLPLALALPLLAACALLTPTHDARVEVGPALDSAGQPIKGAYSARRSVPEGTTRITSSEAITDWAPKEGCVRVATTVGGPDKALRCTAQLVVFYTSAPMSQLAWSLAP